MAGCTRGRAKWGLPRPTGPTNRTAAPSSTKRTAKARSPRARARRVGKVGAVLEEALDIGGAVEADGEAARDGGVDGAVTVALAQKEQAAYLGGHGGLLLDKTGQQHGGRRASGDEGIAAPQLARVS